MRFPLLFLPWCLLLLALAEDKCNWKMPTTVESCTQEIKWKVHDDDQATATCLEYFPTTFLDGTIKTSDPTTIVCTVYRQFQCDFLDVGLAGGDPLKAVPMFDKCYRFLQKEYTMEDYLREDPCNKGVEKGALPIFLTWSQGKHIGKEAHKRGIFKMWANVDREGRTIEKTYALGEEKGFLLYKDLWKVHDATYWVGDKLEKSTKKAGTDEYEPHADAQYLFFRSNTDYVHNLWQGWFELATDQTKAAVVCEYPAKIVPNQERYCEKMGKLGMNTKFDHRPGTIYFHENHLSLASKRCLYSTLSKFPLMGSEKAIQDFTGCKEKPSEEQTVGLDDGTANNGAYYAVAAKGTYRFAAIKFDMKLDPSAARLYSSDARKKCDSSPPTFKDRQGYVIYDHSLRRDFAVYLKLAWNGAYPKFECSDFPNGESGDSNTLAIQNGQIIDVPVPVRIPALCSIASMVDCVIHKNACDNLLTSGGKLRKGLICENVETWNAETNLYARCDCAPWHQENADGVCAWTMGASDCAVVTVHQTYGGYYQGVAPDRYIDVSREMPQFDDKIDRVVVRYGCRVKLWSHPVGGTYVDPRQTLLLDAGYGAHWVPQYDATSLNGLDREMGVSGIHCSCTDMAPLYA